MIPSPVSLDHATSPTYFKLGDILAEISLVSLILKARHFRKSLLQ